MGSYYLLRINLCMIIIKIIVIMITTIKKNIVEIKKSQLDAFSSRLFWLQQYSGALYHAKGRTWSKYTNMRDWKCRVRTPYVSLHSWHSDVELETTSLKTNAPSGLKSVHSIAWRYDMKSPRLKSQNVLTVMRKKHREGEGADVDLKVHMGSVQLGFKKRKCVSHQNVIELLIVHLMKPLVQWYVMKAINSRNITTT